MISQKIGYSFSEEISGFGTIEYSDTQAYPKVTFQVKAEHPVVKRKIITYLTTPRKFFITADMFPGAGQFQKPIAPVNRIDFFQRALAEMNASIGIATLSQ